MAEASGVIGKGIRVKGEIYGQGGLVIEGEVEGRIQVDALTVMQGANVNADIQVNRVVVHGEVNGILDARDRIEIKASASVVGELRAPAVVIEEGAAFKGTVVMDVPLPDDV